MDRLIKTPLFHLTLLCLLLVLLFSQAQMQPMDDSFYYLEFSKKLAAGDLDFSIPGFHGADFFTVIIYLITKSEFSVVILDIIFAFLNIFMIFLAVNRIFQNKTLAILASYIYILCPLDYTNVLRGHHHTPFIFFTLLGIYLLFRNSRFSWLAMGLSYIIRPFSIALAPLYWYKKKIGQFFLSLLIPVIYVSIQYFQIGKIIIGAHKSLTAGGLFSFHRFILNLGYAMQNYFSIHNFSFLHNLHLIDMIHLSPLITFLVVLGVLYYKRFYDDKKLFISLLASAMFALIIPASFYHLDMWYLWTFNLCLILLALPVLNGLPKLIPIVTLSFGFQFLYTYLAFENHYWQAGNYTLFIIFVIILIISIIYSLRFFKKSNL